MITVGIDAHKKLHVATALDDAGREIGSWRGPNSPSGWASFLAWLGEYNRGHQVGIEGAWNYGRGLAQYLVENGVTVFEVNSRWTALGRRGARKPDKSDQLDARAVAMFVLQEAPKLSPIALDDETAILELLCTERDDAVTESTRLRNQLHALLLQIDPGYKTGLHSLKSKASMAALRTYETHDSKPLAKRRAESVRRLTRRLDLVLDQIAALEAEIKELAAAQFAPLTKLCGVNLLTAGTLAGILGPGRRFASDSALAAFAGVSPIEASSAGAVRHRLNRGGHRRLNAVIYRIALTQAHFSPEARAYLARRTSEGKTKREAMRALKRFIVRAIWKAWNNCFPAANAPVQPHGCT